MEADTERWLSYREKHASLNVFACVYWAIYALVVGFMIIATAYNGANLVVIVGLSMVLFAFFLVIYGLVIAMHHRLMRKHG